MRQSRSGRGTEQRIRGKETEQRTRGRGTDQAEDTRRRIRGRGTDQAEEMRRGDEADHMRQRRWIYRVCGSTPEMMAGASIFKMYLQLCKRYQDNTCKLIQTIGLTAKFSSLGLSGPLAQGTAPEKGDRDTRSIYLTHTQHRVHDPSQQCGVGLTPAWPPPSARCQVHGLCPRHPARHTTRSMQLHQINPNLLRTYCMARTT